jgi:hypothetical protein
MKFVNRLLLILLTPVFLVVTFSLLLSFLVLRDKEAFKEVLQEFIFVYKENWNKETLDLF